jgi:hypothetical protein
MAAAVATTSSHDHHPRLKTATDLIRLHYEGLTTSLALRTLDLKLDRRHFVIEENDASERVSNHPNSFKESIVGDCHSGEKGKVSGYLLTCG